VEELAAAAAQRRTRVDRRNEDSWQAQW
jgi:hypothetical protein